MTFNLFRLRQSIEHVHVYQQNPFWMAKHDHFPGLSLFHTIAKHAVFCPPKLSCTIMLTQWRHVNILYYFSSCFVLLILSLLYIPFLLKNRFSSFDFFNKFLQTAYSEYFTSHLNRPRFFIWKELFLFRFPCAFFFFSLVHASKFFFSTQANSLLIFLSF